MDMISMDMDMKCHGCEISLYGCEISDIHGYGYEMDIGFRYRVAKTHRMPDL